MGNGASSNSAPISETPKPPSEQRDRNHSAIHKANLPKAEPTSNAMPKTVRSSQKGASVTSQQPAATSTQKAAPQLNAARPPQKPVSDVGSKVKGTTPQEKSVSSSQKQPIAGPKKTDFHEAEIKPAGEGPSGTGKKTTPPQSQSADKDTAHDGKKQRHKLYFPTVDDLVFETFYHRDGRECECMYMNGQRFYLDSWNSMEWQVFPMNWYDEGMLITNSIINDKEQEPIAVDQTSKNKQKKNESTATEPKKGKDDREGWINHPKRGKIPTYIFEERHNVHCFFDVYSGMWLRLPLGWELIHDTVSKMVVTVETAIPSWKDRYEILAMLRSCNYNPDECMSNYLQIEGDELKGVRNAGDAKTIQAKDQQVSELQKKLKEMERRLNEEIKAKNEAVALASELQTRSSGAEAEMKSAQLQLVSLQQARPKSARPKTPQVTVMNRVSDDDLLKLMKSAKHLNKSYIELKMDVTRWMDNIRPPLMQAISTCEIMKTADSSQLKQLEEVRALYRREAQQRRMLYNQTLCNS